VFNPVMRMELVELCFPDEALPETRERASSFCTALGKTPIEVPDEPGFVVNRLLFPYLFDAVRLLERTGMDPEQVDACMQLGASHPMGPLRLLDLVGIDVADAIGEALHADTSDPSHRPPGRIKRLVGEGRLGRKTGHGFYDYEDGEKTPADLSSAVPLPQRAPQRNSGTDENAILDRLFAQIANEAAFALEEEVASPADMDTAMRLGFNWPRGPIEIAGELGSARAVAILTALETDKGPAYTPAPLLQRDGV
jgi:3-hydroxyacyl-CoA dehydrogenase